MTYLSLTEAKSLASGTKCTFIHIDSIPQHPVYEVSAAILYYDRTTNALWLHIFETNSTVKCDCEIYGTVWAIADPVINVFEWFESTY